MPLPDLSAFFASAPVPPRVLAGAAGVVLLCAGGRFYRLAVVLPGLLLGLGAGLFLGAALNAEPPVVAGLAVVGGAGGVLSAWFLERFAVIGAGVVAGLYVAGATWPLVASGPPAWYLWPIAALVGGLLMPFVWKAALVPLTAALGAFVTIDAAGFPLHPVGLATLTALGIVLQVALGRKRADEG